MIQIGIGVAVAVVLVMFFSLARSAGIADRKMGELHMLSVAREAGGSDGN